MGFWRVITEFTVALKPEILARQPNALGLAKLVFRPDSGDPVKIIVVTQMLKSVAQPTKVRLNVYGKCLAVQPQTKAIKY